MKRQHLHLLGATSLLIACFLTWPSEKYTPKTPPSSGKARHIESNQLSAKPTKTKTPEIKPFFESPQLRLTAFSSALKSQSLEDQKTAFESLLAMPPSARRDEGLAYVLKHLAYKNPEVAKQLWLTWENALTKPWLEAAGNICLALAKKDPFAPSDFILEHIPPTAQLAAWEPIIQQMDYQAATKVLDTFPRSKRIFDLTKSLSIEWMKSDPGACAAWLDSLIPTLTEEQRDALAASYGAFGRGSKKGFDHFKNRVETFNQAQDPFTREYLAGLVLKAEKITTEQKESFIAELAETLPDYHAALTAPSNSRSPEYYNTPVKFASTLKSEDFQNLSRHDQSTLIDRLIYANPEKAAKFLVRVSEPRRLGRPLLQWHQAAPNEALAYVKTFPNTKDYQRAIFSLSQMTAHYAQEESTLALINLLNSPENQQTVRTKLAERMKEVGNQ